MTSSHASRFIKRVPSFAALLAAVSLAGCGSGGAGSTGSSGIRGGQGSGVTLKQLSTDTFTNPQSQHATEVEPGMAAFNSTLVTAFQVGRIFAAGAADIGFATSTDGGSTWINGLLSGITIFQGGIYNAVSDPSVAYDQAHGIWIIASLAIANNTDIVVVSRSSDAKNWAAPIIVSATHDADKPWITCDNNSSSKFFGHCYIEWDDPSQPANGLVSMSTSVNGGLTWQPALNTADGVKGLGGQPIVGANGRVIVPIESADGTKMLAFSSSDGGLNWTTSVMISNITDHLVAGNMRTSPLPSAAVDGSGRVYVVWQDCRFRRNCVSNDIVLSTSTDGVNWIAPVAVPIDGLSIGNVDHFIPALAADAGTSGGSASLTLTYYYFPNAVCTASTCQLQVGAISSNNGGNMWSAATTLAGPMSLAWLPSTSSGVMVGDYVATAYSNGNAFGVFAVAGPNAGTVFNEAINTTASPLPHPDRSMREAIRADLAVAHQSDHPPRQFYDLDHQHPIPQSKK